MVTKQINEVAYLLELSTSMKIHPVFHVSLLELYKESIILGRLQAPPPPIEIVGKEEFEVSKILDSRIKEKKLEYLVHWQGYEGNKSTLEPTANLINTPKMLHEFHCQYLYKPSLKNI